MVNKKKPLMAIKCKQGLIYFSGQNTTSIQIKNCFKGKNVEEFQLYS